MTDSSALEEAILAATDSHVADAIKAIVTSTERAIVAQVNLSTLHAVDEALSMPDVGVVSRAVDPIVRATEQAIRDALTSE